MSARIKAVLEGAAGYVERYGLHKGWLRQTDGRGNYIEDGPVCANGAIGLAVTGDIIQVGSLAFEAADVLAAHLGLEGGDGWRAVAIWNDAPERTAEDVITALRAAAGEVSE